METNLYSVLDLVAEEYGPIFNAKNDNVAIRSFNNLLNQTPKERHNEYKLVKVGSFNVETGLIISCISEIIFNLKEVVNE